MKTTSFRKIVWTFYKEHGRHSLPWRLTRDPYKILVSEIMLQQTQVDRVIPKYESFLRKFPSVKALAKAPTGEVLKEWQGLGYNRRAVNLKRAAEIIVNKYEGKFPTLYSELVELPGVGRATAGDLLAFAWNKPAVVVETNIRSVYMHHFFPELEEKRIKAGEPCKVHDKEIIPLIEKTLDTKNPRDWYYALMDYGSHLKKQKNNIHRSAHYKKQSAFKGSNRELRSKILKSVLSRSRTEAEIIKLLDTPAEPIRKNLLALSQEGLIVKAGKRYSA